MPKSILVKYLGVFHCLSGVFLLFIVALVVLWRVFYSLISPSSAWDPGPLVHGMSHVKCNSSPCISAYMEMCKLQQVSAFKHIHGLAPSGSIYEWKCTDSHLKWIWEDKLAFQQYRHVWYIVLLHIIDITSFECIWCHCLVKILFCCQSGSASFFQWAVVALGIWNW